MKIKQRRKEERKAKKKKKQDNNKRTQQKAYHWRHVQCDVIYSLVCYNMVILPRAGCLPFLFLGYMLKLGAHFHRHIFSSCPVPAGF